MSESREGTGATGLSLAGEHRREEILTILQRAMTSRRRRRRGVQIAGALGAVVLVLGGASVLYSRAGRAAGTGSPGMLADGSRGTESNGHATEAAVLVGNERGIVERVAVKRGASVVAIDDDELARLLEEAGRPSGLVRTRGRVYLGTDLEPDATETAPGA